VPAGDRVAELQRLQELQVPGIRAAFLRMIAAAVRGAPVAQIEAAIIAGRIDDIPAIMGLDPTAYADLLEEIRTAYIGGGTMQSTALAAASGGTVRVRFNVRAPRAEQWLRQHSAELVTRITAEQLETIRETVAAGTAAGRNPRATALDVVGRIDSQTGRRVGGSIGLTPQQNQFVLTARQQLQATDPDELRAYLRRVLRDRRYDGKVRRAIATGKPLRAADVETMVGRYSDSLLRLRGETIARTEALQAFNTAREEAIQQAVDVGAVDPQQTVKIWRSGADARVRDTHAAMNGQRVPLQSPFRSPSGSLLMRPGDGSLGAGAAEIVACRCIAEYRVDFLQQGLGRR
jgi:hypothetical protein